ncbi:STB4 Probable transcriptional regulatory protein STB4 [Candida maltosa Xu316]
MTNPPSEKNPKASGTSKSPKSNPASVPVPTNNQTHKPESSKSTPTQSTPSVAPTATPTLAPPVSSAPPLRQQSPGPIATSSPVRGAPPPLQQQRAPLPPPVANAPPPPPGFVPQPGPPGPPGPPGAHGQPPRVPQPTSTPLPIQYNYRGQPLYQAHPSQIIQRLHQSQQTQAKILADAVAQRAQGHLPPQQEQAKPKPKPKAKKAATLSTSSQKAASGKSKEKESDDPNAKPRMRVNKACDRCRNHKIKCSGELPCDTCQKHNKECTFSDRPVQKRSKDQDGDNGREIKRQRTWQPFGLPQVHNNDRLQYVAHLENRIQYLESLLSTNSNKTAEPEGTYIDETLYTTSSKWRFSRRHQNLLIVELCQSMYSNLSAESQKQVTLPRAQYFGWNMSGVNYVTSKDLPPLPELHGEYVDDDKLIKYFFEQINPLFAIIHEKVFKEQLAAYDKLLRDEIMSKDNDSKTNQTRLFSALLYLIFALAIRMSEMSKKTPDLSLIKLEERLFKYGYEVISILSFEWESFELIQGWLLITLYLRITHRQTSSGHALGSAITMTKAMGLGFDKDNDKFHTSTSYERLKAKRIFWCVFTFDRVFGLQTGRYCGISESDFTMSYPELDFVAETVKDDWLTLPALAMIHIGRVANFVHTLATDNPPLAKYQQINAELINLHEWFNLNGFRNYLFFNKHNTASSLIKSQVKLHYYDLVLCIHSKVLFNYIGRRIASHGLKVEMVIDACNGIIEVLDRINKAGLLYTPWYSNLLLLFNIGVNAITLLNGGVFVEQAREILKNAIRLLTILRKAPIRNDQNKLVFRERFKMVRECMWALKMANRILTLRLQEDISALNNIGTDHGSSDVNRQYFSQLGISEEPIEGSSKSSSSSNTGKTNEFNEVFEKQLHRNTSKKATEKEKQKEVEVVDSPSSFSSDPAPLGLTSGDPVDSYSSVEIDKLLGNLQWFDQWTDFNLDF